MNIRKQWLLRLLALLALGGLVLFACASCHVCMHGEECLLCRAIEPVRMSLLAGLALCALTVPLLSLLRSAIHSVCASCIPDVTLTSLNVRLNS